MSNFFSDAAEWLHETVFDRDNLEFDTDNLRTQAASIKQTRQDFMDAAQRLTDNIDKLRDNWKTDAGREFFEKYDGNWSSQINQYFDLLEKLYLDLEYAATQYEEIKA